MKFHQFSMQTAKFLTASVNFSCCQNTFCQPSNFVLSGDRPKTFVSFPCRRETFCQLPSTFCVASRPSVNFSQLSVLQRNSVNFSCDWETVGQILSTFLAAGRPSVNFHQFWVRRGDLS